MLICDDAFKMVYFNPLYYTQPSRDDYYFLAYEPSLSPHILLVSKEYHSPNLYIYEIIGKDENTENYTRNRTDVSD